MGDENGDNFVKVTQFLSPFLDLPLRILGNQVIPMQNLQNGMEVTENVTFPSPFLSPLKCSHPSLQRRQR